MASDIQPLLQRLVVALVAALALLIVLWETLLAPARPGSSWLAMKALPLALLWPGLARGALRARQLASLLLPFYVADAIVRAMAASGRQGLVAWAVAALGVAAFVALLASFRRAR